MPMNDTVVIHDLSMSTLTGTQVPAGSAKTFARTVSRKANETMRVYVPSGDGSVSPIYLRIAHQVPLPGDKTPKRTLCAIDQQIARKDLSGNILYRDNLTVAFQMTHTLGLSVEEVRDRVQMLLGALAENDGALIESLFAAET